MEFKRNKLSQQEVLLLLEEAENSFNPPLSQNIPYSINEYAKKLSDYAWFILCLENDETIGFTAYYLNQEKGFAYIPQIWVSDKHQRKGIGASMMEVLIKESPDFIHSVQLEVRKNNEKAVLFYRKNGFEIMEDNNNKLILIKMIGRERNGK